jgi:hypothetical protein
VSQVALVTRLATRELWITFRMLIILVGFVGAGAAVALMPAAPATTMERLAMGLAAGTVITAGVAGWSVADERVTGRAGWLVTRSVSRSGYLLGWFGALLSIALVGTAAAGLLGWMVVASASRELSALEVSAGFGAVGAGVAAAVAAGLVFAMLARPPLAAALAAAAVLLVVAAALFVPGGRAVLPHAVLADVVAPGSAVPDALRSGGAALVACAVLLVAARITFERAEL